MEFTGAYLIFTAVDSILYKHQAIYVLCFVRAPGFLGETTFRMSNGLFQNPSTFS